MKMKMKRKMSDSQRGLSSVPLPTPPGYPSGVGAGCGSGASYVEPPILPEYDLLMMKWITEARGIAQEFRDNFAASHPDQPLIPLPWEL